MNKKSIYIALACIPISCGISSAMDGFGRLALTDGKGSGNQMTPYQTTSAVSSYQGGGQVLTNDNLDFTNCSQKKG